MHIYQEFYLPLPNDTRIYHVTYTALNLFEVVRLLNNNVNLSNVLDHQLPCHHSIQSLIQQQIQQKLVGCQIYQQNDTQQQFFGFQLSDNNPSNNNNNNNTHIHIVSIAPQNVFEFYLLLDMCIYYVTYTELNSLEIAQLLNNSAHALRHCNEQSLIQQQIQQQVQLSVEQSLNTQVYSDNNTSCSADSAFSNTEDTQDDGVSVIQTSCSADSAFSNTEDAQDDGVSVIQTAPTQHDTDS